MPFVVRVRDITMLDVVMMLLMLDVVLMLVMLNDVDRTREQRDGLRR